MQIGIPKEVKDHEYRVGATPNIVRLLVRQGHRILVEKGAGEKIGYIDSIYEEAGAVIAKSPAEIYESEMIVKVKEPQESEYPLLKDGQILFCFLHLAADQKLTNCLLEKNVIGIAFETVTDPAGRLPLLQPMSEIAGRLSIQVGATCLQLSNGGRGILLGGVPGVPHGKVTVLGAGVSGTEACRIALGMGAEVTVLDNDMHRLRTLDMLFGPKLQTLYSTPAGIREAIFRADLVIGAVLNPGKLAPKLISNGMLKQMTPGSVIVDLSIDQGGCCETSRPTTHTNPTYMIDGIIHYCVTNVPGACALTATQALANVTMNYILQLANLGYVEALFQNKGLRNGLNVYRGRVTNESIAHDLGYAFSSFESLRLK